MQLRRLRLRNIRSYESAELELGAGTTLIAGDVGTGKTSLLYAIEMALFGFAEVDATYLVRHGATHAEVSVTLEDDGHSYEIGRQFRRLTRRGKETFEVERLSYSEDGSRAAYSATELRQRVIDLFRFPDNPNPRAHSDLWRWAVYVPQERMREVLAQDPLERLETVRKALGLERYHTAAENAKEVAAEIRQILRIRKGEAEQLLHWETELADRKIELDRLEVRRIEIREREVRESLRLAEAGAARDAADQALVAIQGDVRELEGLEREDRRDDGQTSSLWSRRSDNPGSSRTKGGSSWSALAGWSRSARSSTGSAPSSKPNEPRSRRARGSSRWPGGSGRPWSNAWNKPDSRPSAPTARCSTPEPRPSARGRKALPRLPRSPLPGPSSRSTRHSKRPEGRRRRRSRNTSGPKPSSPSSSLCSTPGSVPGVTRRSLLARSSRIGPRPSATSRPSSRSGGRANGTSGSPNVSWRRRSAESWLGIIFGRPKSGPVLRRAPFARRWRHASASEPRSLCTKRARAQTPTGTIVGRGSSDAGPSSMRSLRTCEGNESPSNPQSRRGGSARTIGRAPARRSGAFRSGRPAAVDASPNSANAGPPFRNIGTSWTGSVASSRKREVRERLAEAERGAEERGQLLREISDLERKAAWLSGAFRETLITMEQRILAGAQSAFQHDLARFFRTLVDDPLLEARIDATFLPVVLIDGAWTPADALSGGERTSLALAFRLALGKVVRTLGSLRLDTLILDEPTDGFSPEQVVRMGDLLEDLNLAQVVLVSHEFELSSVADRVFETRKKDGVSSIGGVRTDAIEEPAAVTPVRTRSRRSRSKD
ncbi:MAG: AAA family ATPase [Thermoplasmatales archaeon]|nr:AAA family ATPase [Thermoplasmatales archaeon]